MTKLLIVFAFIAFVIAGSILILWVLARLFRAPNSKLRHASLAFISTAVISAPGTLFERWFVNSDGYMPLVTILYWATVLGALVLDVVIYKFSFKLSWPKSIGFFFANLICAAPLALGSSAVLSSRFIGTYACTKLACAPTLVGRHRIDKCPRCGGLLFVRELEPVSDNFGADDRVDDGICAKCRQFSVGQNPSTQHHRADLIMSANYLEPDRWDLVVYSPNNASFGDSTVWLGRIVGMPGERVAIKDGAVFVNNQEMKPPSEVSGLVYEDSDSDGQPLPYFTNAQAGEMLGENEFCILGDFSRNSNDSRYLGAVPRISIKSVVTACYWPPSRWRIWR